MNIFISLLRGINVGGKNRVSMTALKALLEDINFKNVSTYIQSGNVIFSTAENDTLVISKKIESGIEKKLGIRVPVITRTTVELKKAIAQNPFSKLKDRGLESIYITYLERPCKVAEVIVVKGCSYPPDEFIIMGQEIYIYCPNGYGNTKLNNNFFENKLKIKATTRNWKTSTTLLNMATEAAG